MWGKVARAAAMVALIVALIAGVQVAGGVDSAPADPNLRIAFIGTAAGADCVVVWRTGFAMMVGVADEPDQPKILAFLRNARISRLDYLVLPNPDRVHAELAAGIAASVADNLRVGITPQEKMAHQRFAEYKRSHFRIRLVVE